MASVCRLCLNLCSDYYRDMNLMDWRQFQLVLPEIDLDVIRSPLICFKCIELLRTAYSFKMNCLETERLITSYAMKYDQKHFNVDEVLKEQFISRDVNVKRVDVSMTDDLEGSNVNDNAMPIETKIKSEAESPNLYDDQDINIRMDNIKAEVESDISEEDIRNITVDRHNDTIKGNDCGTSSMDVLHEADNSLKCGVCRNTFVDIFELIEHVSSHFTDVKCLACGHLFTNLESVKQHFIECHQDLVNAKLDYIEDLLTVNHKEEYLSTSNDPCEVNGTCYICGNLISKNFYIRHMAAHLIKNKNFDDENYFRKRFKLKCPGYTAQCGVCGFVTHEKANFAKHMASPHKCKKCNKTFASVTKLKFHIKKVHASNSRFSCEYCSKPVRSKYALKSHLTSAHKPEEYRHKCSVCSKLFGLQSEVTTHIKKKHKNRGGFQCSSCHKKFVSKFSRKQHMSQKHGDQL